MECLEYEFITLLERKFDEKFMFDTFRIVWACFDSVKSIVADEDDQESEDRELWDFSHELRIETRAHFWKRVFRNFNVLVALWNIDFWVSRRILGLYRL